jgi:hypothetical protein
MRKLMWLLPEVTLWIAPAGATRGPAERPPACRAKVSQGEKREHRSPVLGREEQR